MAALKCAHKPTWMYTFTHHLRFVCTHSLCLNKCTYTCTHCTRTQRHCAFEKIRYFVKVLFLWILSFSHRLHFTAANMGQIQTQLFCRGFILITLSGHQVDSSCYLVNMYLLLSVKSVVQGLLGCHV